MQRIVSTCRIRLSIRRKLKTYGKNTQERIKVKMLIGLNTLLNTTHSTIYDKTASTMTCFLFKMAATLKLKRKAFEFNESIRQVQQKWRSKLRKNSVRLSVLRRKWIEIAEEMMKQKGKGKKHHSLIRKLRGITAETRETVLKKYFIKQFKQYCVKIAIWTKYGIEVSLFTNNRV